MPVVPALFVAIALQGALACPYDDAVAAARAEAVTVTDEVAAHAAHSAALLGGHSSYATGLMARRVISDGRDWSFAGQIIAGASDPAGRVAAPYRTATNDGALLVATELLETIVRAGYDGATLKLAGRGFKGEDGVTYVVLTSYKVINS